MGMNVDNGELLKQLRIDHAQREDHTAHAPRWPWLLGVVVLVLLAGGAWWWWGGARAVPVQVVTAVAPTAGGTQGAVLQATGYVTARRMATVSAQIVGTLTQVLIEEGDHVKKGQVLARLEDTAQKARLNQAKASVAAAQAQAHQIAVELAQAKRDMQRQNTLVAQKLVPVQQAEQARTKVAGLEAQLNAQRKQVKAAQANEQLAQVNFDYTIVRAPFAGVITQKTAQVGEIIAPSAAGGGYTRTGVGTIVDMDSLEVDVDVNESYIARVKPDMPAVAVLDAYPDWKIPAHVIAIVPTADKGKATVKVRVALEKKDPRIIPDMGVRVSFLESDADTQEAPPKGVLVPKSAIAQRDGHAVVFVLDDEHAKAVRVQPSTRDFGQYSLLPTGIAVGSKLVDKPPQTLANGAAIVPAKGS